jgi:hypothetical protein
MKKHANYTILPEFRLILECCKGAAMVKDAIAMKADELADPMYNPDYNIIVDFREFETSLDATTKNSAYNFFNFLTQSKIKGKVAFQTSAPHQVVIGLFLKELGSATGALTIEAFSTPESAFRFVGIAMENHDAVRREITALNKSTV